MAELDLNKPLADRAHEAIRQAVVQSIADLVEGQADRDDALFLVDILFELVDGLLTTVDELTARVAALEPAPPPEE